MLIKHIFIRAATLLSPPGCPVLRGFLEQLSITGKNTAPPHKRSPTLWGRGVHKPWRTCQNPSVRFSGKHICRREPGTGTQVWLPEIPDYGQETVRDGLRDFHLILTCRCSLGLGSSMNEWLPRSSVWGYAGKVCITPTRWRHHSSRLHIKNASTTLNHQGVYRKRTWNIQEMHGKRTEQATEGPPPPGQTCGQRKSSHPLPFYLAGYTWCWATPWRKLWEVTLRTAKHARWLTWTVLIWLFIAKMLAIVLN